MVKGKVPSAPKQGFGPAPATMGMNGQPLSAGPPQQPQVFAPHADTPTNTPSPVASQWIVDLKELVGMREAGQLSAAEFAAAKATNLNIRHYPSGGSDAGSAGTDDTIPCSEANAAAAAQQTA